MSMNVLINILFVGHQLLGRKIFRQFFHLPLTGLSLAIGTILFGQALGWKDLSLKVQYLINTVKQNHCISCLKYIELDYCDFLVREEFFKSTGCFFWFYQ